MTAEKHLRIPNTIRHLAILLVFALASHVYAQSVKAPEMPKRPIPEIERVLIISIDGLRPDALLIADAPVLHGLIRESTYTMWARTTDVAVTLPSHVSMLTGVTLRKHGVEWNRDLPFKEPVYPKVPTILELATKAGYSTALVAGKSKFSTLNKPGTIQQVYIPDGYQEDSTKATGDDDLVLSHALPIIKEYKPALAFVHFPSTDSVGHLKGWGSHEQLAAIAHVDACVGKVLSAYKEVGIFANTLVIITADHGGAGKYHGHVGPDDARSRHIPWIVIGPGVKPFYDLTQIESLQVNTEDTAATALWLLGIPLPNDLDGKPIRDAFVTK